MVVVVVVVVGCQRERERERERVREREEGVWVVCVGGVRGWGVGEKHSFIAKVTFAFTKYCIHDCVIRISGLLLVRKMQQADA